MQGQAQDGSPSCGGEERGLVPRAAQTPGAKPACTHPHSAAAPWLLVAVTTRSPYLASSYACCSHLGLQIGIPSARWVRTSAVGSEHCGFSPEVHQSSARLLGLTLPFPTLSPVCSFCTGER